MRINHNIAALNTYRQLNTASTNQSKSMEKLSSGMRINKAGDDAAGLAISEKMRGQIRGLDMAAKNSQDGISLLQTAEGALNETHDILQRMRELANQAANDTNTGTDRGEIQKEINQLTGEINRIGNNTEFNTQKLIDGSKESTTIKLQIGANAEQSFEIKMFDMRSKALGLSGDSAGSATLSTTVDDSGNTGYTKNGVLITDDAKTNNAVFTDSSAGGEALTDNSGAAEYGLDISDHDKATAAVKVIDNAIEMVSAERSRLGAYQNRLDHTINNLNTSSENLTAAESRIRDVDMAKEMMNQTKNSILSQAAQAMLAQSNQMPQGVLQLLR
ncbi:flagellin [Priestia flexa]|uniref:Flagellin n=1 Tax=Priestia veravalensis TaxID=1414648 RepID=A0A0V8JKU4_9BACI|nr:MULTISPECIES: flagellin [Priestia]KSU87687.1 flagellin [Priestia veravalensis]MED3824462.1 flagellin [Priestia flexa]SCC31448.1 flagellin [Priestia flexa]